MPTSLSIDTTPISREELRTFHVAGRGLERERPHAALRPLELEQLPPLSPLEAEYPLYVPMAGNQPAAAPRPFASVLNGLAANPDVVARAFLDATAGRELVALADVRETVLGSLPGFTEQEIDKLRKALPQDGWLLPFTSNALPLLYSAAVTTARRVARERFLDKLVRQCERLRELLQLDDARSGAGMAPEAISASMGTEAGFFDAGVLATAFGRKTVATQPMPAERRERIAGLLTTLEYAVEETRREPAFWLYHSAVAPVTATALGGKLRQCGDSFESALEYCDERLERFGRVLRALRAARLEVASAFEADLHEEWLRRFDWQAAEPDELAALPVFVVLEPAEWLARTSFASFGRLLRSGRPIHVLISCEGMQTHDLDGDLSGFMPDFGYLSIAHREAFVLQTSMSNVEHLTAGLARMAQSLRPSVAVVCVPPPREDVPQAWLESTLMQISRAFPLYRYDPDQGETWMERFQLSTDGPANKLSAVHAAAVSDDLQGHFRVIPEAGWGEEQMELSEYLAHYKKTPPLAIPFIWVTDAQGKLQRAIITRELVNLSRDRQHAWRVFEELAGVRNAYVEAAIANTRAEVQDKVRQEGAMEAVSRVVAMLTNGEALPVAAMIATTSSGAAPQATSATSTATAAEAAEVAEPYIDTFLCTSCNDCMKVNAQVFLYDANKQAYIGNAKAGTFAQLVKAAEGCPARCIHPGLPRADDKTATPAMLARASKFQ